MTPEKLIADAGQLISLPRVYHRINEMLDDPRFGMADIGRVVTHEPALTARVLRLVNSAYYQLPSKIDSIALAITVLGTRALRDLVLATSVASAFSRINTRLVDVSDFWHHSIYTGILARLLGKHLHQGDGEQLFIAGLLHDLGKLVIYHRLPEQASAVLTGFAEGRGSLDELEREQLGFDHAQVGAALLKSWQLPELFQAVTAHHHRPADSGEFIVETSLVHAANALSKKVEPGHKVQAPAELGQIDAEVSARLMLNPSLLEELRLEADVHSIEVFATLFAGTPLQH